MNEYDAMQSEASTDDGTDPSTPVASLPVRVFQAFVSPGRMVATVAEHPRWVGAMLLGAALLSLSLALIPIEVMEEMQRRIMIQSGRPVQEIPESARTIVRTITIVAPAVAFIVFAFIGAAVTTFIFAFVLGDEGTFKQYLAVGVHAAIIPTFAAVLLTPMRIAAEDPQLTINLSTFLVFLPDGYLLSVFQALDVTQIWSSLVTAMGIHAIDRRRTFASAATIQLGMLLVIALIAGWFLARQGA